MLTRYASFLDAHYHTVDGNFQQSQKMKPLDVNDRPLTSGAGFWVDENEAKTVLDGLRTQTQKEVCPVIYSSSAPS